jgi:sulfur carrier protein ThiS
LSPTNQHTTLENIEDQESVAQNREKPEEVVYQINRQIVSKEEWDTFVLSGEKEQIWKIKEIMKKIFTVRIH